MLSRVTQATVCVGFYREIEEDESRDSMFATYFGEDQGDGGLTLFFALLAVA